MRSKVPASISVWARESYSSAEPSHQWMASGWVSSAISPTQSRSFTWVVGAFAVLVWLIGLTLLGGLEAGYFDVRVLVEDLQRGRFLFTAGQRDGAVETRAGLDLDPRRAIDRGDFLAQRGFEDLFDRTLGLGVVDHGVGATGDEEGGERKRGERGGPPQQAHLSPCGSSLGVSTPGPQATKRPISVRTV